MKYYTGVGSRKTPYHILKLMESVSRKLNSLGYVLRSGGAAGADSAFERGSTRKEIYRPAHAKNRPDAVALVRQFHPAWDRLSDYVRLLHTRNAFQVLGLDLKTPSKFLACWTPDKVISHKDRGLATGGTGTAISIADYAKIPVFNLSRQDHLDRMLEFVK